MNKTKKKKIAIMFFDVDRYKWDIYVIIIIRWFATYLNRTNP